MNSCHNLPSDLPVRIMSVQQLIKDGKASIMRVSPSDNCSLTVEATPGYFLKYFGLSWEKLHDPCTESYYLLYRVIENQFGHPVPFLAKLLTVC
jgi:hypothetical protein